MKSALHVSLPNLLAPSGLSLRSINDINVFSNASSRTDLDSDVSDDHFNDTSYSLRAESISSFVKFKFKEHSQNEHNRKQKYEGEKNLGFDLLYHNMKHGQISVKDLQDIIKENAVVEEMYAKHMTKLAKTISNCSHLGTFAPLLEVLKCMAEKLSSCHMDIVHKLHDIIKELHKYLEEQKNKHKQMKEELSQTADALQNIQSVTTSVNKSKEKYNQLCVEAEKLRRQNGIPKDIEKAFVKSNKSADEYRGHVDKYAVVRTDFEHKMTESAKKFQTIEEAHLRHMKSVLDAYILSFENANVLISQVHQEFRRQVDEKTINNLIKQYSEQKGTGTERPGVIAFEECDVNAVLSTMDTVPSPATDATTTQPAKPRKEGGMLSGLRIHRKKNNKKDASPGSVRSKDNDSKDAESIESPDKEVPSNVDEEGYTIRPADDAGATRKDSFRFSSDSDDSDSDNEQRTRKIQVHIKPKENSTADSGGSDLETLNAVTRNLTLASPTPLGAKKTILQHNSTTEESGKTSQRNTPTHATSTSSSNGILNQDLLDFFGSDSTKDAKPTATANSSTLLGDLLLTNSTNKRKESVKKAAPPPPINECISSSDEQNSHPPPRPPKPSSMTTSDEARPTKLSLNEKTTPTHSAPLASSESWSSLSSIGTTAVGRETPVLTPMESFSSSRGPSPLTLSHTDAIPIAVAFTETVNALFKGTDPSSRCLAKTAGEVHLSFPAGITRAFTSNPNPSQLMFKMKCSHQEVANIKHNTNLLQSDISTLNDGFLFAFDMQLLVGHIRKLTEAQPNNPHYNVHVLSYQVPTTFEKLPLHIVSYWKCENTTTDIRIDFKRNSQHEYSSLHNVNVIVPVNGGVINHVSKPHATWNSTQNRILWKLPGLEGGLTELRSRFTLAAGPSKPSPLAVQFLSEGHVMSKADFELSGSGYRVSLVKKRIVTGKYMAESN